MQWEAVLRLAGSSVWAKTWCQGVETESAESKDVQVERWVGWGEPGWGKRCRKERLGAGGWGRCWGSRSIIRASSWKKTWQPNPSHS